MKHFIATDICKPEYDDFHVGIVFKRNDDSSVEIIEQHIDKDEKDFRNKIAEMKKHYDAIILEEK